MPLVSFRDELKKAKENGYGIPLFDCYEKLGADGIILAMEELRAPAIVGMGGRFYTRPFGVEFVHYVLEACKNASVPATLMLDHGGSFEACMEALRLGFTDVMFDGSRLPIEENIEITKAVVRAAHAMGAGVEAELGHVGRGSDYETFGSRREGFTQPDEVERFVEETGVDFLAIAIGSAHGQYKGTPQLDYELLDEIRNRVEIPLVLHGGSGLSDQQFRQAIEGGISKVNIFTDLAMTATAKVTEAVKDEDVNLMAVTNGIRDGFMERCEHYLELFGAAGKAE